MRFTLPPISNRVRHWRDIFGWFFAATAAVYALLGAAAFVRDNLIKPEVRAKWDTYLLLPHWTVSTWVAIGLSVLLVGALEGSFRVDRKNAVERSAEHGKDREALEDERTERNYLAEERRETLRMRLGEVQAQFDAYRRDAEATLRGKDEQIARYGAVGSSPALSPAKRLSPEAKQILLEAVAGDGDVVVIAAMGGTAIQVNKKLLNVSADARSQATWTAALDELHVAGLLDGNSKAIRRLTKAGYDVADKLGAS